MTEPIDRHAALKLCIEGDGHDDERFTEGYNFAVCEIREGLKGLPTVKAEPVRIAEWDGCGGCKACGRSLYELIDSDSYLKTKIELYGTPFCPFCGVKIGSAGMREDVKCDEGDLL